MIISLGTDFFYILNNFLMKYQLNIHIHREMVGDMKAVYFLNKF